MKTAPIIRGFTLVLLVVFAMHGLVIVGDYVGYASFAGEGGNIYELLIKHPFPTTQWAGLYGVAFRVPGYFFQQSEDLIGGGIENQNLLFDCLQPGIENEIYASTHSDFDLSSLSAPTFGEIDTYFGINTSSFDKAENTFTSNITFELGTLSVTAPGTYTLKIDESGEPLTFATVAVKDSSDRLGFAIILTSNFTQGFNGAIINFQGLLPVISESLTTYYFFSDPNNVCPSGAGDAPDTGNVQGNVTDQTGNRLEDVIVEIAGTAGLSDATGFYNISPSIAGEKIYAIKEGYKTYYNNITVIPNTTVYHNIVLVVDVDNPFTNIGPGTDDPGDQTETGVGPGEDVGPGQSDGEDVGPGEAPPVPYVEEPKQIEGIDYIISLAEIKRKLRIDTFHQEALTIFSFKKSSVTLTFELVGDNLTDIMTLDKTTLVVDPNSNDKVIITLWGRPPVGVYKGNLTVDGEINATIPVEIEILPKDKLPVEALMMMLETNQKTVLPGRELKFKTDLRNLLIDQPYPVSLLFTVQKADGNEIIWSYEANVFLRTAFSLIRTIELPKELEPGDYILRASANYLGLASSTSTIFNVAVPFWSKTFLGLKNWIWGIILAVLLISGTAAYFIWRNIQGKKKYHLKVEYSELPKPGPRNVFVGKIAETENKTYMNLENFKVHTIVAGSTGGGKSVSAQIVVEEALERDVSVICFDPTAQWTGMLRACKDKTMFSLYPFFGMKKNDAKAYNGNIRMVTNPREKIDIKKYAKPGEVQVFACHKLDPKDMDIVVANAIRAIFHANFQESKPLKILFVFDEVHRLLPKFGGSGDGFLQIERGCREFRKWGLGILLVSQVLSDFVGTIKANINTEIQMRTRDEGDLERIRQKYGEGVLRSLVKATVGTGMVENPAYNRGRPYFIAFRPLKHSVERLTDEEIEQYNKYNDMVDELDYSLQQIEDEGNDVFDLRLELKLALDKVKQGNFNMVQIYLDGLRPRVEKLWDKIGKKPKEFERELVDESELAEELTKAKAERDKYVKDKEKDSGEKKEEKKEWGWTDDAPPDKLLNLKNGMVVLSLTSLYDEVTAMKDKDWDNEVGEGFNRLADWVKDATGLENLANNMYATTDKDETVKLLKMVQEGKKLPEVKAPEGGAPASEEKKETSEEKPAEEGDKPATEVSAEEQPAATKEEPVEESKDESHGEEKKPPEEQPVKEKKEEQPEKPKDEPEKSSEGEGSPTPSKEEKPSEEKPQEEKKDEPEEKQPEEKTSEQPVERPETPPKEAQKTEDSLETLITENPEEYFKLENGMELRSARELADYLPNMDDSIFTSHVGDDYNHFADWVRGVFHNDDLADKLIQAKTKEQMVAVMH